MYIVKHFDVESSIGSNHFHTSTPPTVASHTLHVSGPNGMLKCNTMQNQTMMACMNGNSSPSARDGTHRTTKDALENPYSINYQPSKVRYIKVL